MADIPLEVESPEYARLDGVQAEGSVALLAGFSSCAITDAQEVAVDHERLTFEHHGRPFRLTDVAGQVVKEIIA